MYALIFIIAATGQITIPAFSQTLAECEATAEAMYERHGPSWICAEVTADPIIIGRTIWMPPKSD